MKPWVNMDKKYELRRSDTHSERLVCVVVVRGFTFFGKVPLLRSSKMCGNN